MDENRSGLGVEFPSAGSSHETAARGYHPSRIIAAKQKVWHGRWILLWSTVACMFAGMLWVEFQPPFYKLQTTVQIETPDRPSQMQILSSFALVARTLKRLPETERAHLLASPDFWWRNQPTNQQRTELIRQHVSATWSSPTGMVQVSFLAPDPTTGAHFLNTLVEEWSDINLERRWRIAQHNRKVADNQIEELRERWGNVPNRNSPITPA